jgi:hypothetical protein
MMTMNHQRKLLLQKPFPFDDEANLRSLLRTYCDRERVASLQDSSQNGAAGEQNGAAGEQNGAAGEQNGAAGEQNGGLARKLPLECRSGSKITVKKSVWLEDYR